MIRGAVIDALKAAVPEVEGRVYEVGAVPKRPTLPFLQVAGGGQTRDGSWEAMTSVMDVWAFAKQESFDLLALILKEATDAIDDKRFVDEAGASFFVQHTGSASVDQVAEEWQALARAARFNVYQLGWLTDARPVGWPDVAGAFREWTELRFPMVENDPNTWTPDAQAPAVYWRVERITRTQRTPWGAWQWAIVRGHVLSPERSASRDWMQAITERLAVDNVVPIEDTGRTTWLRIVDQGVQTDSEADAFRQGQIGVLVKHGVIREEVRERGLTLAGGSPAPAQPLNTVRAKAWGKTEVVANV